MSSAKHVRSFIQSLLLAALAGVSVHTAGGLTVTSTADDNGHDTLRYLVNHSVGDPIINFSVTGDTIILTQGEIQITNSVTINGPGAKLLAVDGAGLGRVFNVSAPGVSISGLTIQRGSVSGSPASGGGILNSGSLTLTACQITNCAAIGSDSLLLDGGMALGGGICNSGQLAMAACTVINSGAQGGSGQNGGVAEGGGLYNGATGSLALTNCTVTRNRARGGDGNSGSAAVASGGGIADRSSQASVLVNCTVAFNEVGIGNPISQQQQDLVQGRAIGAVLGGGVFSSTYQSISMLNTLVGDNLVTYYYLFRQGWANDTSGHFLSLGGNVIGHPYDGWPPIPLDPLHPDLVNLPPETFALQDVADYGGQTLTIGLPFDSFAHNAGNAMVLSAPYNLATDQRGEPRGLCGTVDSGAYQLPCPTNGIPQGPFPSTVWTGAVSGKWEGSTNWLLGPPAFNFAVGVTNAATFTITIDSLTSGSFSNLMTITNFSMTAPTGSIHTLLMTNAGTARPLRIHENLLLLSGSALTVNNSAIQMNSGRIPSGPADNGSSVLLDGPVAFTQASLNATDSSLIVLGTTASGSATFDRSSLQAASVVVGSQFPASATFLNSTSILNGALILSGTSSSITGKVSIAGGSFIALSTINTSTPSLHLNHGVGQVTISTNALVQFGSGLLGVAGGHATLTQQSGNVSFSGPLQAENANINLQSGTFSVGGNFTLASESNSFAQVNLTGGTLSVTNGVLGVGNDGTLTNGSGTGQVNISGGTLQAVTVNLGSKKGGRGDITISGTGNLTVNGGLQVNDLTVNGGTVQVIAGPPPPWEDAVQDNAIVGGHLHDGAMTVNAGTVSTPIIRLGVTSGNTGTLTVNGGTVTVQSNLWVGDSVRGGLGVANLTGGSLNVHNPALTAVMDLQNGSCTVGAAATLTVDNLIMTNNLCRLFNYGTNIINNSATLLSDTPWTNYGTLNVASGGVFSAGCQIVNRGGTINISGAAKADFLGGLLNLDGGTLITSTGAVYTVTSPNDSGPGTLRDGLAGGYRTITFAITGTIGLLSELPVTAPVTVIGPGAPFLTLDGHNACRIFNIGNDVNLGVPVVSISGLTMANGFSGPPVQAYGEGGAVRNSGTLTVSGCTLCNSTSSSSPTAPSYYASGGAIFNSGTLTLLESTLNNNLATGIPGTNGTGSNARAGAVLNGNNTLTVVNCTFTDNAAAGGVSAGGFGGAIYSFGGALGLTNSTIVNNRVTSAASGALPSGDAQGGGVYILGISIALQNNVFGGNAATAGPGAPQGLGAYRDIYVYPYGTTFTSGGYNFIPINEGSGVSWVGTDLTGTNGSPLDAQLGPLWENGGPTLTMAPLAGSPVLGHGNSAISTDQRGYYRASDHCDIGAFQTQPNVAAPVPPWITDFSLLGTTGNISWMASADHFYRVEWQPLSLFPCYSLPSCWQIISPVFHAPNNTSAVATVSITVPPSSGGVGHIADIHRGCLNPAADDASQIAYGTGVYHWNTGDNGGSGFLPWTNYVSSPGNGAFFIGDSSKNGTGGTSGDINTGVGPTNHSWGIWATNGAVCEAVRPFVCPLAVSNTFTVGMDNGVLSTAGKAGFQLRSGNTVRFEFYCRSNISYYLIRDAAGERPVPGSPLVKPDGMTVSFTLQPGGSSYTAVLIPKLGPTFPFAGGLLGNGSIDNVEVLDANAGGSGPDQPNAVYFNSLQIQR